MFVSCKGWSVSSRLFLLHWRYWVENLSYQCCHVAKCGGVQWLVEQRKCSLNQWSLISVQNFKAVTKDRGQAVLHRWKKNSWLRENSNDTKGTSKCKSHFTASISKSCSPHFHIFICTIEKSESGGRHETRSEQQGRRHKVSKVRKD